MPFDASQLYSKNISTFLGTLIDEKAEEKSLSVNMDDEIIAASIVTHEGGVPNEQTRANLGQAD